MVLFAISAAFLSGMDTRAGIDAQQHISAVNRSIELQLSKYADEAGSINLPVSGSDIKVEFENDSGQRTMFSYTGDDVDLLIDDILVDTLGSLNVNITQFDVTKLNADPDAVRIDIGYEASTFRSRTLQFSTSFTFTNHYVSP